MICVKLLLIMLNIKLGCSLIVDCPKVEMHKGKLMVRPKMQCEISNDVKKVVFNDIEAPGRWYGMISYNCSGCTGMFISVFEGCDDCTLCKHNELFLECRNNNLPKILGLIFGFLFFMTIVILMILVRCVNRKTSIFSFWCTYYTNLKTKRINESKMGKLKKFKENLELLKASEVKEMELIELKNLVLRSNIDVNKYKDFDVYYEHATALKNLKKNINKWSSCNEIQDQLVLFQDFLEDDGSKSIGNEMDDLNQMESENQNQDIKIIKGKTKKTKKPKFWSRFFCFFCLLMQRKVDACDQTFFFKSDNTICIDEACNTEYHSSIIINSRGSVCLVDELGDIVKLDLLGLEEVTLYKPIYYTSSYRIQHKYRRNCQGSGLCDYNNCRRSTELKSLTEELKHGLPIDVVKTNISGSNCKTTNLICSPACWYIGHECVFTSWLLVTKPPVYEVYEKTFSYWRANLQVQSKAGIKQQFVTPNNPYMNYPVHLIMNNAEYAKPKIHEFVVKTEKNEFFYSPASHLNQPVTGTIGDIQIELINKTTIYPIHSIKFETHGCDVDITYSEPSVDRVSFPINKKIDNLMKSNKELFTSREVNGFGQFLLNTTKISSILVTNPVCDFVVKGVIGCYGCDTQTNVFIQAINLKVSGLMKIKSNCSLDTTFLSCQDDPQKILLLDNPVCCRVEYGKKNLTFCPTYDFLGNLDEIYEFSSIGSESFSTSEFLWTVFNNPNFLPYCGLLAGTLTLSAMVLRIGLLLYTAKKARTIITDDGKA